MPNPRVSISCTAVQYSNSSAELLPNLTLLVDAMIATTANVRNLESWQKKGGALTAHGMPSKAAKNLARLSGQFTALDGVLASQSARNAVSGSELATALPQLQDLINQTCDRFLLGASGTAE